MRIKKSKLIQLIKEELLHTMGFSPNGMRDSYENAEWVTIGEFNKLEWSNQAMKNLKLKRYIQANSKLFQEIEELKEKSPNGYLKFIRNIQDVIAHYLCGSDVLRALDENGEVTSFGRIVGNYKDITDLVLYPEFENSIIRDIFDDWTPSKEDYHREFLSNLEMDGNNVVLKHYSDNDIKDGYIKRGEPNYYTPNSDYGFIYFWGSKMIGSDPSSGGRYLYTCEVPIDEVYDFSSNIEGFKSRGEALQHYPYIAYYWQDEDAICVKTTKPTKIVSKEQMF